MWSCSTPPLADSALSAPPTPIISLGKDATSQTGRWFRTVARRVLWLGMDPAGRGPPVSVKEVSRGRRKVAETRHARSVWVQHSFQSRNRFTSFHSQVPNLSNGCIPALKLKRLGNEGVRPHHQSRFYRAVGGNVAKNDDWQGRE